MSSEYSSEGSYPSSASSASSSRSSSPIPSDDDEEASAEASTSTRPAKRRKGTTRSSNSGGSGRLAAGVWEEFRRKAMEQDGKEDGDLADKESGEKKGAGRKKAKLNKADRERKKRQEEGKGKESKFLEVRTPKWRSDDVSTLVSTSAGGTARLTGTFACLCHLVERSLCEPGPYRRMSDESVDRKPMYVPASKRCYIDPSPVLPSLLNRFTCLPQTPRSPTNGSRLRPSEISLRLYQAASHGSTTQTG